MTTRTVALVATDDLAGERVDRVLALLLAAHPTEAGLSRSALARLCDEGRVTVRGVVAKSSARVRPGDPIVVEIPPPLPTTALPEELPLVIVFEDRDLLVVDKPAGLVVHPSRGHAAGTLVNAVLFHATVDDADVLRPGIVHRIDKDTSGLLVVAKTPAAREGLVAQFKVHSIERSYLALTDGVPAAEVTYETLHGRHPTDRMRFTAKVREGKRAVTHVRVLERFDRRAALLRCTLTTGRTHQIRMHLSEAGFPLLGDALYGRRAADVRLRAVAAALGRQALHAEVLGFRHPVTGAALRFTAAPPADFAAALAALRALTPT